MNMSLIQFVSLLLLGALYLPVIFFAVQRRDDGQGISIWLVALFALLAMVMTVAEVIWRNKETSTSGAMALQEFQIYITLTLIAVLMLAIQTFLKRETWWVWAGLWGFWMLGLALILTNVFHLPDALWTNGSLTLQRARLAPAWAILGWLTFSISLIK